MSAGDEGRAGALKRTPLYDLHLELGAKMVPFAGYEMPVQYPMGILGEHQHTRDKAGLFDVSHMGQAFLVGPNHETSATALEKLVPADIRGLALGAQRYTQLLNDQGGIIDDLMIARSISAADDGRLFLVVNAACKDIDFEHIRENLPEGVDLKPQANRALLALQGPAAGDVMARHCPKAVALPFMSATSAEFDGIDCHVSRSGYTGEDGFEISVANTHAVKLARNLLGEEEVAPIGLGARDSLRLEAGLCLYGHDIDETTSPVEAGLSWSIQRRRREQGGFPGFARIRRELTEGPSRRLVGIVPEGRAPAREGTVIQSTSGVPVGSVTSGGFGPTFGGPIAMGYVQTPYAENGTVVDLVVRGTPRPARIVSIPFVPHRYHRPKRNA